MGADMSCCAGARKLAIDVIPDREVMIGIVDTIVKLEELLKKGERLTPAQEDQLERVRVVTNEMTKLKKASEDSRQ